MGLDEIVVYQVRRDDDVGHGVEKQHVGAALDGQVNIGDAGRFGLAGIYTDNLASLFLSPHDAAGHDRMRRRPVVADVEDDFCIFDFGDVDRHGPFSYGLTEPGNRWSVSNAGAVVDVVRADDGAHEFLHDIGRFVSRAAG